MPKRIRLIRGIRLYNAFVAAQPVVDQVRSLDGRFAEKGVKAAAVVVVETRQQRRYKALQATKNPLPLIGQGGRS